MADDREFLSTTEAAEMIGCGRATLARAARLGHLPAIRVGRIWAVTRADVEAWATRDYQPLRARKEYRNRKRGRKRT